MNMIKPLQAITAMAVAASFLSLTPQVSKPQQVNSKNLYVECNKSTIFSGFKFTLKKCNQNVGQLTISNTYASTKKLSLAGNIIFNYGSLYHLNNGTRSIITFPSRGTFVTYVSIANVSFEGIRTKINISPANITSKLVKPISLACDDGTQKIAGIIFTPTCSNQAPRFIAENTTNSEKVVVYYGSRGDFKFRISTAISPKSQQQIDLSAGAKSQNFSSQKHKLEIRN